MVAAPTIIDAHVHQWDPRTTPRSVSLAVKLFGWSPRLLELVVRAAIPKPLIDFVAKPEHALNPYLPADLRKDWEEHRARMAGVVHVQAAWETKRHFDVVDETMWLERIDPVGQTIRAIVGAAHLEAPDLAQVLDAHSHASRRFRGVRDIVASHPSPAIVDFGRRPNLLQSADWRSGYEVLGQKGLSFDAWMYHHQLDDFAELAKATPGTPFVLCHLGTPVAIAGEYGGRGVTPSEQSRIEGDWKASIAGLAEVPHARFKLSGILMPIVGFGAERRSAPMSQGEFVDRVGPLLTFAIETIGIDRCMFGSNFPMDKVSIDFATLVSGYDELLSSHTEEERQRFFAGTAREFYRIDD